MRPARHAVESLAYPMHGQRTRNYFRMTIHLSHRAGTCTPWLTSSSAPPGRVTRPPEHYGNSCSGCSSTKATNVRTTLPLCGWTGTSVKSQLAVVPDLRTIEGAQRSSASRRTSDAEMLIIQSGRKARQRR